MARPGSLEVAFSQGHSWSHAVSQVITGPPGPGTWSSQQLRDGHQTSRHQKHLTRANGIFLFFLFTFISKENSHPYQEERTSAVCPDYNVTTLQCNYKNNHRKGVLLSFHQVSGSHMVTCCRFTNGSELRGRGVWGWSGRGRSQLDKENLKEEEEVLLENLWDFSDTSLRSAGVPEPQPQASDASDPEPLGWAGERGEAGRHREVSPRGPGSPSGCPSTMPPTALLPSHLSSFLLHHFHPPY